MDYQALIDEYAALSCSELAAALKSQLADLNVTDIPLQLLAAAVEARLDEVVEYDEDDPCFDDEDDEVEVFDGPTAAPVIVLVVEAARSGITVNEHGVDVPLEYAAR